MLQHVFNIAEYTRRNIFLTGKAGTGKTTFLNDFTKKTAKKYVIVAPTGIAAINAGGVTIHSMFGLPLTTFVPTYETVDLNESINIQHLLPHFKYRKDKLKLLQHLEILIIDEVSMLRADLLDMIDMALKTARRSALPFGGVQLLMVGDLYQLPPVVKPAAERLLSDHYPAPYFFASKALNSTDFITVELKTVYRQTDARFITLLNAIRNGDKSNIDFHLLNSRYQPDFEAQETYIYLVTHNYLADAINLRKLEALGTTGRQFKAIVSGDFKENLYPNDPELLLKSGAQVMFIRNDTSEEKRYYNGMLATIIRLSDENVTVQITESQKEITVEREVWENKKYYLDENREIQMEVAGSYEQFPFRLAWAVTIHKSQGLTFDRVIIDAGQSFTSGQVYVALSRCRTLEGIVLKSPISAASILRDDRITDFHSKTDAASILEDIYEQEKNDFAVAKLLQQVSISGLASELETWVAEGKKSTAISDAEFLKTADPLAASFAGLEETYAKFERFMQQTEDWQLITSKSMGAVGYFFDGVYAGIYTPLFSFSQTIKSVKGLKGLVSSTQALMEALREYLETLETTRLLDQPLCKEKKEIRAIEKAAKKPSHMESLDMLNEGKSPDAIASLRRLTVETIFSHFSKAATAGKLDIRKLFTEDQTKRFQDRLATTQWGSLNEVKSLLPEFEYYELRVLMNHYTAGQNKK